MFRSRYIGQGRNWQSCKFALSSVITGFTSGNVRLLSTLGLPEGDAGFQWQLSGETSVTAHINLNLGLIKMKLITQLTGTYCWQSDASQFELFSFLKRFSISELYKLLAFVQWVITHPWSYSVYHVLHSPLLQWSCGSTIEIFTCMYVYMYLYCVKAWQPKKCFPAAMIKININIKKQLQIWDERYRQLHVTGRLR